ncbi:MAG: hypothetical protein EON54_04070 [Alcaligenaceae bacterium]|nr:MAG: hypothetical protein EON54_04070 [Alcaligenaceae bacterium]
MQKNLSTSLNRCGYCGASSFHRVVARDETGAMRYTKALQCTGCSREFSNLQVWRQGMESAQPPAVAP